MASAKYDPEANALYVRLTDGKPFGSTEQVPCEGCMVLLDRDENGDVIGVEVLLPERKPAFQPTSRATLTSNVVAAQVTWRQAS